MFSLLSHFSPFFSYYGLSLFLGGLIAFISSSIVYASSPRNPVNSRWFLSNLFAAIWSFGYLSMISTKDHAIALGSNWILHAAAIFIPLFYFSFVTSLTNTYEKHTRALYFASVLATIFSIINPTKLFIEDVVPKYVFNFAPEAGPTYVFFTAYFFILVGYALIILWRKVVVEENAAEKYKLKFIFFTSVFGFGGGGVVFFLTHNIPFPPYTLPLFSLYPLVISYAMIRHRVFNVRLIATESFVLALWIFILFRTILSDSLQERIINGSLLAGTVLIGIFLIRSVIKEVETRERIEKLAGELGVANERLKMLDQQKSEFVSIASHQLRSPLTAIKGYSSMILEGSFGTVSDKVRDAVDKVFQSSQHLVNIIEDFLNISRIEQGRMKYEFSTVDLRKLAQEVIGEMKPTVDQAGLKINLEAQDTDKYLITGDLGKVKQVINNIVDNAIKYTPKGSMTLSLSRNPNIHKIYLKVRDTGVGISPEAMKKLFEKFSRAEGASKVNIRGTGLGLFVAREIMKAHRGNIWAESPGEGRGSTFIMEFLAE